VGVIVVYTLFQWEKVETVDFYVHRRIRTPVSTKRSAFPLPKSFRKDLGNKVVMTRGLDNCLFVYSQKAWREGGRKVAGTVVRAG